MSIINDALKKTEESIQRNLLKEIPVPGKKPKLKTCLIYIAIFVVGIFLSSLLFKIINRKISSFRLSPLHKTAAAPEVKSETEQALPSATPIILPQEQEKPKKSFVLNGIFFSDNSGYALVNNQIIKENDLIDGAKVEKITANTVEINNEGEIITLSTSR
ncbi:MAG: hypothetical protein PHT50_04000 [Candidatus Omnitrophica bacterium]|nr:hypothetical protein [Candidatus Omnitrophota bacterium]